MGESAAKRRASCSVCHAPVTAATLYLHGKCKPKGTSVAVPTGTKRPDGKRHEAVLIAALKDDGWIDAFDARPSTVADHLMIPGWAWGLRLDPPRRFQADVGIPAYRILVEVEGQAHSVRKQRRADILREQAARSIGLRIVRVLPEQCHDGTAVEVIRDSLAGGGSR